MFDNLGKRIQSALLVALVVFLALVMGVIGFGTPQMQGCRSQNATWAARVYGTTITEGEFRAAYALPRFNQIAASEARVFRLRELTLEGLIERELLVREAERLGFTADPVDVLRRVMDEQAVLLGGPIDAPSDSRFRYPTGSIPQAFSDRNGEFQSENMRRYIQNYLHRSMEEFSTWQVKETLAEHVRNAVAEPVGVSPREVWDAYVSQTERAQINYVRYSASYYRDQVEVEPQALTTWMQSHQSDVDQEYRRQRHLYTHLPLEVRARHILIKTTEGMPEADRTAARARAEALLHRALAGEDFAALARQNSEDEGSARRGGDLGYNRQGTMVRPFDDAQFAGEPHHVIDHLVESTFGFHIIKVEDRREGDVAEDVAKRELAEGLYTRARAIEMAHEQAVRGLAYVRDNHTMEQLDDRLRRGWDAPDPAPAADPEHPEAPPERDRGAPQVQESSRFGRADAALPGAFDSGPLTRAVFEMTADHPLPTQPIQLGDDWLVYRLMDRTEATQEGFDHDTQDRLRIMLLGAKRRDVLSAYIHRLLARAEADGAIRRNEQVLVYETPRGENGEPAPEGEGEETP